MSKFCAKCGQQMQDDDFLCPECGAIWGDRVYRVPTSFDAEDPLAEDAQEDYAESSVESDEQRKETAEKKQPRWLLPVAALVLVLAFGLFLIGTNSQLWAGEGSTAPSTTAEPTASPSTAPVLPYTVYTVKFVDPYGTPIPGVGVENLLGVITSGYLSSSAVMTPAGNVISDECGEVKLTLFIGEKTDPYVHILSVPRGYDQNMVGYTKYFAEGQTEMLIVLKFSDEPAEPSWDEEGPFDYMIRFIDPDGNPVPNVLIYNPILVSSSAYLYSDEDGTIRLTLDYKFDAVVIAEVPEGYSKNLLYVPQYFDGGTYMEIVIDYDYTEIDPVE